VRHGTTCHGIKSCKRVTRSLVISCCQQALDGAYGGLDNELFCMEKMMMVGAGRKNVIDDTVKTVG
jgi:NAD/NADP transhydrogenase beta subunit